MCGICGLISPLATDPATLTQMCDRLTHRGPDDAGFFRQGQAHLAMRRLSIIDLETGQQPISNEDESLWLVYNGEIYNYRTLRQELEEVGHRFKTAGDAEVVLHAYEEYGPACLERFNGMFAFAIWDSRRQRLFVARDRVGIKPLFYAHLGDTFLFGSEIKALLPYRPLPRTVDLAALDQFLSLEYIPAPRTIFEHVRKLPAGTYLSFENSRVTLQRYWDPTPTPIAVENAVPQLQELLADATRLRMVSDVPLGAFLSGGIDSSAIVMHMARQSTEPIRTFSVGFADQTYNELPYARQVATMYGTHHVERTLAPDIGSMLEQLVAHLDEPFGDFSIFPTFLVSQMAAESVKVVLSGDGGDEVFGGYDTYVAQSMARRYAWLPSTIRQRMLPHLLNALPPQPAKKGLINKAKRFVEGAALPESLQHTRWMIFMDSADKLSLYRPELAQSIPQHNVNSLLTSLFDKVGYADPLAQQQYVDINSYLVENILTKVDRMSMAASIETRVPFLDHRIVAFGLGLPPEQKIAGGSTKRILREALAGQLPTAVLNKGKQGFSIPLKHWLTSSLKPIMCDLLSESTIRRRGYFEPDTVARWISQHLAGRANHSHRLWALMVLELWHRGVMD